jgi:hypothetical protein
MVYSFTSLCDQVRSVRRVPTHFESGSLFRKRFEANVSKFNLNVDRQAKGNEGLYATKGPYCAPKMTPVMNERIRTCPSRFVLSARVSHAT